MIKFSVIIRYYHKLKINVFTGSATVYVMFVYHNNFGLMLKGNRKKALSSL